LLVLAGAAAAQPPAPGNELLEAGRLIESGEFDRALTVLESVLKQRASDPQALGLQGMALAGLERWPQAYDSFAAALKFQPDYPPALRGKGIAAYNLGRYPEAIETLRRHLAAAADDQVSALYLGRSLLSSGQFSAAADVLDRLADLRGSDPWVQIDLAQALTGAGKKADAANLLLQLGSSDVHLAFRAASMLFDLEKYAEAIERFRSIAGRYPDPVAVGYNLALACFRSGQLEAAQTELRRLVQTGVSDGDVFSLLGAVARERKQVREAFEALREATRVAPEQKDHHIELLALCIEMENYEDGLKAAAAAIARHPQVPELYHQRAILYSLRNQFTPAEQDFRRALALDPKNDGHAIGLTVALMSGDRLEEARELLASLVGGSRQYLAWYLYADVLIRLGAAPGSARERSAFDALNRALELNPKHADSRLARARLWKAAGRLGEAAAELRLGVEAEPGHRACVYELFRLETALGHKEQAQKLARRMEELTKKEADESWQHALLRQQMMQARGSIDARSER
jgi:tetratricopeptide (TPR) repeat protein